MRRTIHHMLTISLIATALLIDAAAEAKPAPSPPAKSQVAASAQGVVNINTASEEQLRLLPRVGPTKAKRISQYRAKQKFKTTWDLMRVKGIGRKTFRRLRPFLAVAGETTLTTRPKLDDSK
jgi:competence protein ComEA